VGLLSIVQHLNGNLKKQTERFNTEDVNNQTIDSINITVALTSSCHVILVHRHITQKGRISYLSTANSCYNLQRQKTSGIKIPIAMATGTSMLLESSEAYGSVMRGSAIRRRLLGSVDTSRSSSSGSSTSSWSWGSSAAGNGASRGTSTTVITHVV